MAARTPTSMIIGFASSASLTFEPRVGVEPFVVFQRAVYDEVKKENSRATTYDIKAIIGEKWRAMSEAQKRPYKLEAQRTNRQIRRRLSSADPEQLLVRHEMWLQPAQPLEESTSAPNHTSSPQPDRVLVHYLGDDAYQCLSVPPRPILVHRPSDMSIAAAELRGAEVALVEGTPTAMVQLQLLCAPLQLLCAPVSQTTIDNDASEDVGEPPISSGVIINSSDTSAEEETQDEFDASNPSTSSRADEEPASNDPPGASDAFHAVAAVPCGEGSGAFGNDDEFTRFASDVFVQFGNEA